jgi:hypothetical protein
MSLTKFHDEKWTVDDIRTATAGEAIAFARACVKLSAEDTIVKCTADTDHACGLVYDDYASGVKDAQFIQRGRLQFVSGGTVTVGCDLCPDDGTAGRVRAGVTGDWKIGTCVVAGSSGEFSVGEFDFVNGALIA